MKKLMTIVMLIAVASVMSAPLALASSTVSTPSIATQAVVDGALSMTVVLKKNNYLGAVVTSIDFGKLIELTPTTGSLRSSPNSTTGTGNVTAFITANSHGLPYTVTTKGTVLTSGTNTIPGGACGVAVTYATGDNNGAAKPATLTLASPQSWVSTTDKTLFSNTGSPAAMSTVQAAYSITDDTAGGALGGALVPLSQPGGTYTGAMTISVTA
jgi:hypothetical protein